MAIIYLPYGVLANESDNCECDVLQVDDPDGLIGYQNFISGSFYERFFNLFTLEKFIVTGPATDEFKNFTQENGFVIEYRNSVDGFIR